jgi:hypothetical protein
MGEKTRERNWQAITLLQAKLTSVKQGAITLDRISKDPDSLTYKAAQGAKLEYNEAVNEMRDLIQWLFDADNVLDEKDTVFNEIEADAAAGRLERWSHGEDPAK